MKQVFNNSMTAHVWAQQSQQSGRNTNRSIFFEGATIYSYGYHFPMATFSRTKQDKRCVLVNNNSYSVSTSSHQSDVNQAIRFEDLIFYVDNPLASPQENIKAYDTKINQMLKQYPRKRSTKARFAQEILGLLHDRNAYLKSFMPRNKARVIKDIASQADKLSIAEKKAEKALYRKKLKQARDGLKDFINKYGKLEDLPNVWRKDPTKTPDRYKWDNMLTIAHHVKLKSARLTYPTIDAPCLLRVSNDKENIETSWGAEVPYIEARQATIHILNSDISTRLELNVGIGHFRLEYVENDMLKAGCHLISINEIKALATREGWI